jgi:tRNA threonylcarbamoyladenosine biosynthesis protein TsaE
MTTLTLPDAASTVALGRTLARTLRAGDLVVLVGDLGAGKTTLTQGIGAGLGVRGTVASPTFIIARSHASTGDGPDLVHVDAYRIGSLDEIDALDLDTSLADSVTVVEWGEGLVEQLADDWLEVRLERPRGGATGDGAGSSGEATGDGGDHRTVTIVGHGGRWDGVELPPG